MYAKATTQTSQRGSKQSKQNLFSKFEALGLKHQITIIFFISVGSLALLTSLAVSWQSSQLAVKKTLKQGESVTNALAKSSTLALVYGSEETAREAIEFVLSFPGVMQAAIVDNVTEEILYQHGDVNEWHSFSAVESSQTASLEYENDHYWQFGSQVVVTSGASDSPFENDMTTLDVIGRVQIIMSKSELKQLQSTIFFGNISISAVLCIILFSVLRTVIDKTIGPFAEFASVMDRAKHGEQGLRLKHRGSKELRTMVVAFNRMMTVIEDREKELVQARDEALESSRLKSEFVANVSHEIRTPMNGVIGMLNLLDENKFSAEEKGYISVAKESGQSLLILINSILDFSKLNADQVRLEHKKFNLESLIENTLTLYSGVNSKQSVELSLIYEAGTPSHLWGDGDRIKQLLNNLISNAVKFTQEGRVSVLVKHLEEEDEEEHVEQEHEKNWLSISVSDTGIGVPADYIDHIFEPYSQQDGSISRKFGGTGLGLAICKRLVELMNGKLSVTSEPGKGSCFTMELPFFKQKESPKSVFHPNQYFDHFVLLTPEGVAKETLINLLNRWQLPYTWLNTLENWQLSLKSKLAKTDRSRKLGILMNEFDLNPSRVQALNAVKQQCHAVVIQYRPLQNVASNHTQGKDNEEQALAVVDIELFKPIRRFDTEDRINSYFNVSSHAAETKALSRTLSDNFHYHVLIVEDNMVNQKVAKAHLKKLGVNSSLASNGLEAIEAVQKEAFDMILMDCQMPVLDGFEATQRIRALGGFYKKLPIIALSANTRDEDQAWCLEIGMNSFIGKPFTIEQLTQTLQEWIPDFQVIKKAG